VTFRLVSTSDSNQNYDKDYYDNDHYSDFYFTRTSTICIAVMLKRILAMNLAFTINNHKIKHFCLVISVLDTEDYRLKNYFVLIEQGAQRTVSCKQFQQSLCVSHIICMRCILCIKRLFNPIQLYFKFAFSTVS
jgi:hypothetical protein